MNTPRENSHDKILDAAFRLLSKKGYANVSMRDIAAEAQVALGLLTYHFRTKENLFDFLETEDFPATYSEVNKTIKDISEVPDNEYSPISIIPIDTISAAIKPFFDNPELQISNLMTKINESSIKEIWIQKNMYNEEFQKYNDII